MANDFRSVLQRIKNLREKPFTCDFDMALQQRFNYVNGKVNMTIYGVDAACFYAPSPDFGLNEYPFEWCMKVDPVCKEFQHHESGYGLKNSLSVSFRLENRHACTSNIEVKAWITVRMLYGAQVTKEFRVPEATFNCQRGTKVSDWKALVTVLYSRLNPNNLPELLTRIKANIEYSITYDGKAMRPPTLSSSDWLGSIATLLQTGVGSDCTLISSDGKKFSAHKIALSAQSDVLKLMFEQDPKLYRINVADARADTVRAFLDFVYGKIEWRNSIDEDLMLVATKYGVKKLTDECVKVLMKGLKMDNASRLLKVASSNNLDREKGEIIDFIVKDVDGFIGVGGFKKLDSDLINLILDEAYSRKRKVRRGSPETPSKITQKQLEI